MVNPDKIFGRLSNRMFQMAALYAYCKDNGYHIFVQDEKYFKKYENEIRALYTQGVGFPDYPVIIDKVSVHVRRTDYVNNGFYVDLGHHQHADMHHQHADMSDNYYVRAMDMFPGEKFLVFSDDIEWCKQSPLFKGCEFSEGKDEVEDLNLMMSCKSHIIANSSFSWWGAWLGINPDKKVIAPKQWFADPENEKFIGIPKRWLRL